MGRRRQRMLTVTDLCSGEIAPPLFPFLLSCASAPARGPIGFYPLSPVLVCVFFICKSRPPLFIQMHVCSLCYMGILFTSLN